MIDGVPEVSDFKLTDDTLRCPKCDGPMDQGNVCLIGGQLLAYEQSVSPRGGSGYIRSARSCIQCGYTELFTDPAEVRCVLAGVKPPKRAKK